MACQTNTATALVARATAVAHVPALAKTHVKIGVRIHAGLAVLTDCQGGGKTHRLLYKLIFCGFLV